jgi:hypothetical protein
LVALLLPKQIKVALVILSSLYWFKHRNLLQWQLLR